MSAAILPRTPNHPIVETKGLEDPEVDGAC
jgi:hypothetical protein